MNEYIKTILLGVPSGMVSALAVWGVIKFYQESFLPRYRRNVYRGVELEGEWLQVSQDSAVLETSNTFKLNIENQYGHELIGWFSQDYKDSDGLRQGRYKFNGQVVDGTLILSLYPSKKSKSTFGTVLMQIGGAGDKLTGMFTYKSSKTDKIVSTELELKKE